jgi:hypothetical protein
MELENQKVFLKDVISLEELAHGVYHLVQHCEIDPNSRTESFIIGDTSVDVIVRGNLVLSVSRDRTEEVEDDEYDSEEVEDDERDREEVYTESERCDKQDVFDEKTRNKTTEYEWTVVKRNDTKKRTGKTNWRQEVSPETKGKSCFYVFQDDTDSPVLDFAYVVTCMLEDIIESGSNVPFTVGFGYAYSPELERVYKITTQKKDFIELIPSRNYVQKFKEWLNMYKLNGCKVPVDLRMFKLYRDHSMWTDRTFVQDVQGLVEVRRKAKSFVWSHAIDTQERRIYNFSMVQGKLLQKTIYASQDYIDTYDTTETPSSPISSNQPSLERL